MNFLGLGLTRLIALWSFLKATPWIWKLITNYKTVQEIMTESWMIFENCANRKSVPTREESAKLLDNCAILFEKEFVDLPNLDEVQFARMIREMRMNLLTDKKEEITDGK